MSVTKDLSIDTIMRTSPVIPVLVIDDAAYARPLLRRW